jgi:integrase
MPEKRVTVWVQRFKDRASLMLQWIDPDTGKRKSRSAGTDDPDKAETARADLEYELNHGRYQEASRMSWDTFRELFEREYVADKRLNTRENYEDTLDLFERLCGPARLRSITERTLSQFVAGMREMPRPRGRVGLAPSTIAVRLEFLRTALRWAVSQKMLPECPRFPSVKVPRKKPQPVAVEAFERLVAKAPDEMTRAYLLTGWLAGLRLSEAYALEWEPTDKAPYLDLARDRIVLPAEFAKSVEDQWVPLDPALRGTLLALPRDGAKVFRFPRKDGRPITDCTLSWRVIDLAKAAGVKLSMHTLRKGFGCRYAGKVPAQVLQRLMRHADIKTTMGYYANVDDAAMEAVLGSQRNSSRNTPTAGPDCQTAAEVVNPSQDSDSENRPCT